MNITREELVNRFCSDIEGLTSSPITNPMNTRHALMLETYELGIAFSEEMRMSPRVPSPKDTIPKDLLQLHSKAKTAKERSSKGVVWMYLCLDEGKRHISFRSKKSPTLTHDIYYKECGPYRNLKAMNILIDDYYDAYLR